MPTKKLSKETENKIKDALETTTKSHKTIADEHGVSVGTIGNVKKKHKIQRPKEVKPKADPTNARILELESKVIALKDERAALRKSYQAAQRNNSIYQALAEEIHDTVKPIRPLPRAPRIKTKDKQIHESLVMHLSDEHACDIVLPHQVGGLENYNERIALRRAEVYVDSLIKFTQHTLKQYNFGTLFILANGDHVSGEIHDAKDHTEHRNTFKNCLSTGQMHALMLRDLAAYFDDIKIIYTPGNHGRRTPKKDHNNPKNNWDYLVAETAFAYARDLENVEFIIPDSFSINLDIEGHGFHVAHGDDIKSFNNIPWYGIERKTRRLAALNCAVDRGVQYFCFGHFHNPATQAALNGETIINGTWVATSPYVYNSLSSFTEPTQIVHGVHKERGVTWRLHIKLRSDKEHLGPKRYGVILK